MPLKHLYMYVITIHSRLTRESFIHYSFHFIDSKHVISTFDSQETLTGLDLAEKEEQGEALSPPPLKVWTGVNLMEEEIYLVNSCTTNTILKETKYFHTLTKRKGNILTIAGRDATIEGAGCATITLPMGTHITIKEALLYPDSSRTLLSYRDIRKNRFHVETHEENKEEYLLFTKDTGYDKQIVENIPSFPCGLYYT
jgi:hypothetical protein